jgi:hypothetical protein
MAKKKPKRLSKVNNDSFTVSGGSKYGIYTYHVRAYTPGEGVTTIYKAKDGYRWRAKHKNGEVVAESGESYVKRAECIAMAEKYAPAGFDVKRK